MINYRRRIDENL